MTPPDPVPPTAFTFTEAQLRARAGIRQQHWCPRCDAKDIGLIGEPQDKQYHCVECGYTGPESPTPKEWASIADEVIALREQVATLQAEQARLTEANAWLSEQVRLSGRSLVLPADPNGNSGRSPVLVNGAARIVDPQPSLSGEVERNTSKCQTHTFTSRCIYCGEPAIESAPLTDYMSATTTVEREAAFLRLYAMKIRNGTELTWEIPNTRAATLNDIATQMLAREAEWDRLTQQLAEAQKEIDRAVEEIKLFGGGWFAIGAQYLQDALLNIRLEYDNRQRQIEALTREVDAAHRQRDEAERRYNVLAERENRIAADWDALRERAEAAEGHIAAYVNEFRRTDPVAKIVWEMLSDALPTDGTRVGPGVGPACAGQCTSVYERDGVVHNCVLNSGHGGAHRTTTKYAWANVGQATQTPISAQVEELGKTLDRMKRAAGESGRQSRYPIGVRVANDLGKAVTVVLADAELLEAIHSGIASGPTGEVTVSAVTLSFEPSCTTDDVFDFKAHLRRQREWSERTFGPDPRVGGVIDHITKELREIEQAPTDLSEWIDVVILALDGAWRAGHSPEAIIAALQAKQAKNEARTWPDWRTLPTDKAITHVPEPSRTVGEGQGPNRYGHQFGKPYEDGYATCHWCGCRENTAKAATVCRDQPAQFIPAKKGTS